MVSPLPIRNLFGPQLGCFLFLEAIVQLRIPCFPGLGSQFSQIRLRLQLWIWNWKLSQWTVSERDVNSRKTWDWKSDNPMEADVGFCVWWLFFPSIRVLVAIVPTFSNRLGLSTFLSRSHGHMVKLQICRWEDVSFLTLATSKLPKVKNAETNPILHLPPQTPLSSSSNSTRFW